MARAGSLLIYAPVPLYRDGQGDFLLEDQACNGLRLWVEHFDRLVVVMPVETGRPPPTWVPLSQVGPALDRIDFVTLPAAWSPLRFLRALPAARRSLRAAMARADRLGFALGGLVGDWGAVGAWEAARAGRPFFVWTDRVESEVTRLAARTDPRWRRRLKARLTWRAMAAVERALVRRADLGLFHGKETFDHYAPDARKAFVVHDIHIRPADRISAAALADKRAALAHGPLRIVYAGRAEPMKGAMDWVETLLAALDRGIDLRGVWLGDGSELARMRARVAAAGAADRIALPGHVADRGRLFAELRAAQVFLFCHRTPESPRCLIEALASGTPIVGYDGAFAREVAGPDGGRFVPRGAIGALAAVLAELAADRAALAALVDGAAAAGATFEDAAVFRHRSELIIAHLPGPQPAGGQGAQG